MNFHTFDIIVIGGGHAAIEAALAPARLGLRVALLTLDPARWAQVEKAAESALYAGEQAEILNRVIEDMYWHKRVEVGRIREFVGHTPIQVLVGSLLGIGLAILFY